MRVAVITPCYNAPPPWLDQCRRSVLAQTFPCTHILVNDGGETPRVEAGGAVQVAHLPGPHHDAGNAGRAVGSVLAICQGFDALTYLDADNWYEPRHLETLVAVHQASGAAVCSSGRALYAPDGTLLGPCPEVDGERFVDTNCLFLTAAAFRVVAAWYLVPRGHALAADRCVWQAVKDLKLRRAHTHLPTVAYRTTWRVHFDHFGVAAPEGAKVLVWDAQQQRYVTRLHRPAAP
jgi:glycosyltransferase involved in cell wall biosynthesis